MRLLAAALAVGVSWTALTAGGADIYNRHAQAPTIVPPKPSDTEYELRWDNGRHGYVINVPAGTWVGNDFDTGTLTARTIKRMRFYSSGEWPNASWDGVNVGLFRFSGVPGAQIWGPKFVRGTNGGFRWCEFDVDWVLPKGINRFIAAVEQIYIYPAVDPYCLDTSSPKGRGWKYYGGVWEPLQEDSNFMVRVVLEGEIGVRPVSLGRVKALYY